MVFDDDDDNPGAKINKSDSDESIMISPLPAPPLSQMERVYLPSTHQLVSRVRVVRFSPRPLLLEAFAIININRYQSLDQSITPTRLIDSLPPLFSHSTR